MPSAPRWLPPQQARLDAWDVPRSVDVHCHCLPGLDDGPETMDDALDLCRALVDDGVTTVVATPHQLGVYDGYNTGELIRETVPQLVEQLAAAGIPLEIFAGADVRVDERLAKLVDRGEVLTVADGRRHLLLELPHQMFVDPLATIHDMRDRGIQTIMTHPERHKYLAGAVDRVASWVKAGAVVQITAGSLLGDFGGLANQESWRLLHAGLVSIVATDAHDAERRPPRMSAALEALAAELGDDVARALCLDNPLRVLQGEPVPAPARPQP
jgi:protein-tyrosine phosphatase